MASSEMSIAMMEEEMYSLTDEALEEMIEIIRGLGGGFGGSGKDKASKAELQQCQKDILEMREQMSKVLESNLGLETNCRDLEKKWEGSCLEITSLREELQSEKEQRLEAQAKIKETNESLLEVIQVTGSLISRVDSAEGTIKKLEEDRERRAREATSGDEAIELLNTLSNEHQVQFSELGGEMKEMRETLGDLKQQLESKSVEMRDALDDVKQQLESKSVEMRDDLDNVKQQLESKSVEMVTVSTSTEEEKAKDEDEIPCIIIDDDDDDEEEDRSSVIEEPIMEQEVPSPYTSSTSKGSVDGRGKLDTNKPGPSSSTSSSSITHARDTKKKSGMFCLCGSKFAHAESFKKHIRYHTSEKKFQCPSCPRRFVGLYYLNAHTTAIHRLPKVKALGCRKCGKLFKTMKALRGHSKSCRGGGGRDKKASSATATVKTASNSAASDPSPRQHGRDYARRLFCLCGSKFALVKYLNKHIKYHAAGKTYMCNFCSKGFPYPGLLNEHLNKCCSGYNMEQNRTGVSTGSHKCKRCGQGCKTVLELAVHLRVAHKLSPKSRISNRATTIVDTNLQQHGLLLDPPSAAAVSEREGDTKRFYCKCGISYSTRQQVYIHMRLLVTGKLFQCSLCSQRFGLHSQLKRHVKKVHGVNYDQGKFACSECGETFETSQYLLAHRLASHGVKK